jgi:lipopolysaccharide export LptBFGC system permease protein LptF
VVLLDRYILVRFLSNFVMLFTLLFVFAVSIDIFVQLDEFVSAAEAAVERGQFGNLVTALVVAVVNFHGPRVFQFYAYLLGLTAVGAMGFTLAQMHRHKELVAVLASGISMHRVAMPFLVATVGLNALQMLNQEFALPRLAPLLVRTHDDILGRGLGAFEVPLVSDGRGTLLQSTSFNPATETLGPLTVLVRDTDGRTLERISADAARWDVERSAWILVEGVSLRRVPVDRGTGAIGEETVREPIGMFETSLSPRALTVRRYRQYAQMLSLAQIAEIAESGAGIATDELARYRYSRLAVVLVNMLVLIIALPSFLLREPTSLLRQSVLCAVYTVPVALGAFILMNVSLPGLQPGVAVFFPAVILLVIAMARWTFVRT